MQSFCLLGVEQAWAGGRASRGAGNLGEVASASGRQGYVAKEWWA